MPEMSTYERAIQIYQVLLGAAHNRQILTYEILGKKIGVPARGLSSHLVRIMNHCCSEEFRQTGRELHYLRGRARRPGARLRAKLVPDETADWRGTTRMSHSGLQSLRLSQSGDASPKNPHHEAFRPRTHSETPNRPFPAQQDSSWQ